MKFLSCLKQAYLFSNPGPSGPYHPTSCPERHRSSLSPILSYPPLKLQYQALSSPRWHHVRACYLHPCPSESLFYAVALEASCLFNSTLSLPCRDPSWVLGGSLWCSPACVPCCHRPLDTLRHTIHVRIFFRVLAKNFLKVRTYLNPHSVCARLSLWPGR